MYVLVIGGGKVGFYLVRELLEQGHEVLLVERDPAKVERVVEELGNVAVLGDGCEVATLTDAGAARCEVFVAVTGDDEDNLVSCQIAKQHFKVPRTIARLNNPKNEHMFHVLGIDVTVSGTTVLMGLIEHEMPRRALLNLVAIQHAGVEVVEAVLLADARGVGKSLGQLGLPKDTSVAAVIRQGEFLIPSGPLVLRERDEVIALCKPDKEDELRDALLGPG